MWKIIFFSVFSVSCVYCNDLSVLYAESAEDASVSEYFCTMYNHLFMDLPTSLSDAKPMMLKDLVPSVFCSDPLQDPSIHGKLVTVSRGNCTFLDKANRTQLHGGKALVIVSKEGLLTPGVGDDDHHEEVSIPFAVMTEQDYLHMKNLSSKLKVKLFAPLGPKVDYNLIAIWVLAVGTLILGSLWSGKVRHRQWLSKRRRRLSGEPDLTPDEDEDPANDLEISPTTIIIFVVLMCGMLVALYFLYDYLVYVIIGVFVLASSSSMYAVLKLALIRMPCIGSCKIPKNNIPLLKQQPEIRRIVLFLLCLSVGILWGVERHQSYAWILQDILGIFFCVNMMKTIRLPSFKACTILLLMLFVYDIFFVFITPLLTKTGDSIMVDVATGGSSKTGEMLPMVLKVPRISLTPETRACRLPHSLLGFGDILVPGLLVGYNYGFDLIVGSPKVYWIVSVIGYGLGLIVTFIALALMEMGQPALLYLVPFTLLPTLVVALLRKEVSRLWNGADQSVYKEETPSNSATDINQPQVVTDRSSPTIRRQVSRDFIRAAADPDNSSQASSDNEQNKLLK